MAVYQLDTLTPRLAETAWVADSAQVIGNEIGRASCRERV